jgi:hypothetical protein
LAVHESGAWKEDSMNEPRPRARDITPQPAIQPKNTVHNINESGTLRNKPKAAHINAEAAVRMAPCVMSRRAELLFSAQLFPVFSFLPSSFFLLVEAQ